MVIILLTLLTLSPWLLMIYFLRVRVERIEKHLGLEPNEKETKP